MIKENRQSVHSDIIRFIAQHHGWYNRSESPGNGENTYLSIGGREDTQKLPLEGVLTFDSLDPFK